MNILVIGLGSIGKRHAQNAADFADEVAVYDMNENTTKSFADEHNLRAFLNLQDALEWTADGVVIATPHTTHISLAQQAVQHGSHVLIEKPISHSAAGLEDFLNYADREKRLAFVVCNMRYHQAVKALQGHMHLIGKPLYARAQYGNYLPNMRPDADYKKLYCAHKEQGGGVILDVVHEIDYLSWFFGPVTFVTCDKAKLSDLDIDVEDYAEIILTHGSGVKSTIHMDYLQQFKRRGCEVIGTEGTLIWESEGKNPELCRVRLFERSSGEWRMLYHDENQNNAILYADMMRAFIEEIKQPGLHPELSSAKNGLRVLNIALAAHQSAEMKQIIEIKE